MAKCGICDHKDRRAIEIDIVSGMAVRHVGQKWGLDKSLVWRHKQHIKDEFHVEQALSPHPVCASVPAISETAKTIVLEKDRLDLEDVMKAIRILFDQSMQLVTPDDKTPMDVDEKVAVHNNLRKTLEYICKLYGLMSSDGTSPSLIVLQEKYEKMKQFLMSEMCDDCRYRLSKLLEE